MSKICSMCKEVKEFTEFNRLRDGLQGYCRNCQATTAKKYYDTGNKKQVLQNKTNLIRDIIKEWKNAYPCTDCGKDFPSYVKQFDHIGTNKKYNVSAMAKTGSVSLLVEEILKCEIVCANCHMVRTHNRKLALVSSQSSKLLKA